jgi:hypothetical protein
VISARLSTDLNNLKTKNPLIFLCTEAWLQYPLDDQEKWFSEGSLNYNIILQLDLFCKREEKWTEIPYMQFFFYLQDHPEWLHNCFLDTQTLAVLCKPQDKHGEGGAEKPLTSDKAPVLTSLLLLHLLPHLVSQSNIQNLLMDVSPFNRKWQEEGESMPLPVIRSKGD